MYYTFLREPAKFGLLGGTNNNKSRLFIFHQATFKIELPFSSVFSVFSPFEGKRVLCPRKTWREYMMTRSSQFWRRFSISYFIDRLSETAVETVFARRTGGLMGRPSAEDDMVEQLPSNRVLREIVHIVLSHTSVWHVNMTYDMSTWQQCSQCSVSLDWIAFELTETGLESALGNELMEKV